MSLIEIMEGKAIQKARELYFIHLESELNFICKNYTWINLKRKGKILFGEGCIDVNGVKYCVKISYSPFYKGRMDRIYISNHKIEYHDDIHVYGDSTLCLYYPYDKPLNGIIPLHKMIPWITEWCHFYEEWKKYGVWLAPEVKHVF